ncbi:MAG: hypothetical protein V1804_00310 [Patescibacteria group bacterium]
MGKKDLAKKIRSISKKNKNPFFCIKTVWGRYYFGNKVEVFQDQILKSEWKVSLVLDNDPSRQFSVEHVEWIRDVSICELSEMFCRLQKRYDELRGQVNSSMKSYSDISIVEGLREK